MEKTTKRAGEKYKWKYQPKWGRQKCYSQWYYQPSKQEKNINGNINLNRGGKNVTYNGNINQESRRKI